MRSGKVERVAAVLRVSRGDTGVTLVETLVALGLLAISAGAISRFLSYQIRMSSDNYLTSRAYAVAEKELEDIRMQNYDDMAGRSSSQQEGKVTYTVQTGVSADTPAPNMKSITVTVGWEGPMGAKNVTLYTIYTSVKR